MNNQRGILTSILAVGATGAAIYGISRGVQNGTFRQMTKVVSNALNSQPIQQMAQPMTGGMTNNSNLQQTLSNQNNQ